MDNTVDLCEALVELGLIAAGEQPRFSFMTGGVSCDVAKVETADGPIHHRGVEVAFAAEAVAGVQQRDLRAAALKFGGIEIGGDIALDDSDGELTSQFVEGGCKHRGLSGTW